MNRMEEFLEERICKQFDYKEKNGSPEFWLNMLEAQVREAREHHASGENEKLFNEIADCIIVAYDALYKLGFKYPFTVVEKRIKTRMSTDKISQIIEKYYHSNGTGEDVK